MSRSYSQSMTMIYSHRIQMPSTCVPYSRCGSGQGRAPSTGPARTPRRGTAPSGCQSRRSWGTRHARTPWAAGQTSEERKHRTPSPTCIPSRSLTSPPPPSCTGAGTSPEGGHPLEVPGMLSQQVLFQRLGLKGVVVSVRRFHVHEIPGQWVVRVRLPEATEVSTGWSRVNLFQQTFAR